MLKLGVFVGEENWTFFDNIYKDIASRYQSEIFKRRTYNVPFLYGRLNHWAFQQGIKSLLDHNDVCFFEWASDYLAVASHMHKRCKIITRLHSFELYEWAPKINWQNVDRIILLSETMKNLFGDLYPDQRNKIIIINNGISLSKFNIPPSTEFTHTLGMLGRISPIKRIYEVILLVYNLVQSGYPIRLRIAGNPDDDYRYYIAVQRLTKTLNLNGSIYFDGFVNNTPDWLHGIDVYLSNSYWEGQQTALIEAMASGCYCLSHFWAGSEEILPDGNIYITESDLREKIISYINCDQSEKKNVRMLMRSIAVEKFDIETTIQEIIQVIDQIM